MRVNLVVASGVHQGKTIAIPGPQFFIGRDPSCHLRPASPAISKKHSVIFVREGKLYIRDLGSTNGTFVNEELITGDREITHGDQIKVGPLDFAIQLVPSRPSDSTPLPEALQSRTPSGSQKPAPKPSEKPTEAGVRSALTPTPSATKPVPAATPAKPKASNSGSGDPDDIAAMLLGLDDDPSGNPPEVPEGSTVHEMPALDLEKLAAEKKAENDKKKNNPSAAETSMAASEILKKYMRREK
ncbi:MAG: FHA domain-containing protein [Bacteroidales bacterium]|nr:FHA domain-containing protein [Bacteroidales bacterium]